MPSLFSFRLFKKASSSGARSGIAFADGSYSLALVRRNGQAKPSIDYCATHKFTTDLGASFRATLEKLSASAAPVCAVIDSEEYQIVQVEAPEVLPSELNAAIRWRLRDAINFSVDEATVDVFETPARRIQSKMLFAVAGRNSAIQRISNALQPIAKGFNAIDIPELCLRNVSALLPQDNMGVATLAVHDDFAQLIITRQAVMYLSRRIDTTRNFNPHATSRGGVDIDAGALALELQRSLDYYESHYDQTPIGDLVIAPANDRARLLADALKSETSLRIAVLDIRELFDVEQADELVTDWPSLMALGAALRIETQVKL